MDAKPTLLVAMSEDVYKSAQGHTLRREPEGRWTLRNRYKDVLDSDQYRHDIAERHNLKIAVSMPTRPRVTPEDAALLEREFPDFDRSTLPRLPEGFTCAAWHNDSCPLWYEGDPAVQDPGKLMLAVDFADPDLREFPDSERFSLHMFRKEGGGPRLVISSDDWEVVENTVRFIRYVRDLKLGFHVDTPGADYVNLDGARTFTEEEATRLDLTIEGLRMDAYELTFAVWRTYGLIEDDEAEDRFQLIGDQDAIECATAADEYWHRNRASLKEGMVFRCRDGDVVRLDHRVPGDGTKWYVADWHRGWSYEDSQVEPIDLVERLPDDYAGEPAAGRQGRPGPR